MTAKGLNVVAACVLAQESRTVLQLGSLLGTGMVVAVRLRVLGNLIELQKSVWAGVSYSIDGSSRTIDHILYTFARNADDERGRVQWTL